MYQPLESVYHQHIIVQCSSLKAESCQNRYKQKCTEAKMLLANCLGPGIVCTLRGL